MLTKEQLQEIDELNREKRQLSDLIKQSEKRRKAIYKELEVLLSCCVHVWDNIRTKPNSDEVTVRFCQICQKVEFPNKKN